MWRIALFDAAMKNTIVTTARKTSDEMKILAENTARKLNLKFVERKDFSADALKKIYGAENILIAKKNSLNLLTEEGELFFHPNTAHLRIKNLRQGLGDRLITAGKISNGMKILDCTLGLGSDAIVESFAVGESGKVTALEINPVIAEIVRHGMKNFSDDNEHILKAMRRVEILTTDYLNFLKSAENNSFDVVYFDPMFRHALKKSSGINPIRPVADNRALTVEAVQEACRVAKNFVVMKENSKSHEFERLSFEIADGGKYSPISFGVIDCRTKN